MTMNQIKGRRSAQPFKLLKFTLITRPAILSIKVTNNAKMPRGFFINCKLSFLYILLQCRYYLSPFVLNKLQSISFIPLEFQIRTNQCSFV